MTGTRISRTASRALRTEEQGQTGHEDILRLAMVAKQGMPSEIHPHTDSISQPEVRSESKSCLPASPFVSTIRQVLYHLHN
jgi:hypothetical protein